MPDLRTRRAPLRVATYPRRVRDLLRTTGPVASPQRVRVPAPLPRPRRGGLAPRLPAAGGTQSLDPRPALSPTLTRLESLRPRTTRGPKGVLVNGFRRLPTDRRSIAGVIMGFVPEEHGSWMTGQCPGEGGRDRSAEGAEIGLSGIRDPRSIGPPTRGPTLRLASSSGGTWTVLDA